MPDFNETSKPPTPQNHDPNKSKAQTAVAQSFPPNTSRAPSPPRGPPRRLDRSRERYPRGSLSPQFVDLDVKARRTSRDVRSPSVRPAVQYDEITRRVSTFDRRPKSDRPPMRYGEVIRITRRTSSPSSPSSSEGRHRVKFENDGKFSVSA